MKTVEKVVLLVALCLLVTVNGFAQRGHQNGRAHGNTRVMRPQGERKMRTTSRVVVRRSAYRPAKIVVYHPHWRPNYGYHRRWVYFPRYNFYWDNWRQGYYYMNGPTWVFNATPPPVIVNVNLEKESNYELKEDQDDVDDVYRTNDAHVKEFKADTVK